MLTTSPPVTVPVVTDTSPPGRSSAGTGQVLIAKPPSQGAGIGFTGSEATGASTSRAPNGQELVTTTVTSPSSARAAGIAPTGSAAWSRAGPGGEGTGSGEVVAANGRTPGGGVPPGPAPAPLPVPRLSGSSSSNGQTGSSSQSFGRTAAPSYLDALGWKRALCDRDHDRSIRILSVLGRPG